MTKAKNCSNCAKYVQHFRHEDCGKCVVTHDPDGRESAPSHWKEKTMTKADRIRSMDDGQLADFMARTQYANCKEALGIMGIDFFVDEESLEKSKEELLRLLQEPVEEA